MMANKYIYTYGIFMRIISGLLLFVSSIVSAQQSVSTVAKGKVISTMTELEGVYVVNSKTEQMVQTNKTGDFAIPAVKGDTLVFSMIQYNQVKLVLNDENFGTQRLEVKMNPVMNYLDEVVIKRYNSINAVSLGIIPAGQRSYTPAERKYATASSARLNPQGLDPLLNLISGRTAMLKKEVEVEKKERFIQQLEYMFEEAYFINKFKVPAQYAKGFMYYVVENPNFIRVLETKNKVSIEFLLTQLAEMYKTNLSGEIK